MDFASIGSWNGDPDSAVFSALLVDPNDFSRNVFANLLIGAGFRCYKTENASGARALLQRTLPDLVILDLKTPIDGETSLIHSIDAIIPNNRYLPIVAIVDSIEHIEPVGEILPQVDDYVARNFSKRVVSTKFDSFKKVLNELNKYRKAGELATAFQQTLDREYQVAAGLYQNMVQAEFVEASHFRYLHSAKSLFNGDILLSAKTLSGAHTLLIGDFTGHGLSASIGAAPTAEIFYGMTRKGFGIRDIILEINRKLFHLLPVDMFCAICILTLSMEENRLSICTGGLPDHYLINDDTGDLLAIESRNLPLGIVGSEQLEPEICHYQVDPSHRLYLFTDGVTEARNSNGLIFGQEQVEACLYEANHSNRSGFECLTGSLEKYRDGYALQDDLTLVELCCDPQADYSVESRRSEAVVEKVFGKWKIDFNLDIATLVRTDPVPVIVDSVMHIQPLQDQSEKIFMIISELVANVLNAKLADLDLTSGSTYEQFQKYLQLPKRGADSLAVSQICVGVAHRVHNRRHELEILVETQCPESGGLPEDKTEGLIQASDVSSMELVTNLCESVKSTRSGNGISVLYVWDLGNYKVQSNSDRNKAPLLV